MPLSEEEQKMLEEIERNFYDNDPALAKSVRSALTVAPKTGGSQIPGIVGIAGGLALVVLGLVSSIALSYLGFLAMVAGAIASEQRIRALFGRLFGALNDRIVDSRPPQRQRRAESPGRGDRRGDGNDTNDTGSPETNGR